MKNIKILTITLAILILLSTGVVIAAGADYDAGYKVGREIGSENFGTDKTAYSAWSAHIKTDEFKNFNGDIDEYYNGFRDGYEDGLNGAPAKVNYASVLGTTVGNIYGTRDAQQGNKSNWNKALPTDRTIRSMFNLDVQTTQYRDLFLYEFKVKFQEAYLTAYERSLLEPIRVSLQDGIKDGEELGKLLGATFGAKDYYEGRTNDFTRDLPSERLIITEYSLRGDSNEYRDGFLTGFVRAYEEEYNKVFRQANLNETLRDEKDAYPNGKSVGVVNGEIKATEDFMSQRPNDWKREVPRSYDISVVYSLWIQSANYRDGFIAGYLDGYSEGYNAKYKELAQGSAMGKSVSQIIPLAGGNLTSLDNSFNVFIDKGTYYNPVNLTIDTTYNVNTVIPTTMIKASNSYNVKILNTSANLVNDRLIELSFEYYGDKHKGGIYKLVDNKWMYIPSIIEEGVIRAYVKPSSINNYGSTYSVFVDSNAQIFTDARGHWAKDEINALVRRKIIYGYSDMTFKPERNISRAEFLTLLSRVYNWNLPVYTSNTTKFKDYSTFGNRNGIISYALSMGYIRGYDDGTFKPNDTISYKEIEIIIGRVLGNSFRWTDVSTKMLYDKKVKSPSYANTNNKITRAEIAYMLYGISESRY